MTISFEHEPDPRNAVKADRARIRRRIGELPQVIWVASDPDEEPRVRLSDVLVIVDDEYYSCSACGEDGHVAGECTVGMPEKSHRIKKEEVETVDALRLKRRIEWLDANGDFGNYAKGVPSGQDWDELHMLREELIRRNRRHVHVISALTGKTRRIDVT